MSNVEQLPVTSDPIQGHQQVADIMLNTELLAQAMIMAEQMATARVTVPKHLQGNVGDCYAITLQALQWRMNPFVVAQKTHLVNGTLGYEAQLVNAVVSASGAIRGNFHYEYEGEGNALACRVGAVLRGNDAITWGEWLKSSDVTTKNSPLWKTNPRQQLGYLQVKNWARLYAPGAILGVYTSDELQDSPQQIKDVTPERGELPAYPDDEFQRNLPKWRDLIDRGRRTADQVIATVASRYALSPEQADTIHGLSVTFDAHAEVQE